MLVAGLGTVLWRLELWCWYYRFTLCRDVSEARNDVADFGLLIVSSLEEKLSIWFDCDVDLSFLLVSWDCTAQFSDCQIRPDWCLNRTEGLGLSEQVVRLPLSLKRLLNVFRQLELFDLWDDSAVAVLAYSYWIKHQVPWRRRLRSWLLSILILGG